MLDRRATVALVMLTTLSAAGQAVAQTQGGVMRIYLRDNWPSTSIHEEATVGTVVPFMSVYNNLVLFDQMKPKNSIDTIQPELASSWAWDAGKTKLTFKLEQGVKWHDGKPFTAKDVKCTFDLVSGLVSSEDFRKNPRKVWYHNVKEITTGGDHEVTFHLNDPQPSFLALLASGYSPVYPCHVPQREMRTKPVGTGPFKVAELKRNESVKLVRNADYWKKGKPYLDGIDWKVIENRSTRVLAFVAGEFDMTYDSDVSVPLLKDVSKQSPKAICKMRPTNVSTNLIVNPSAPPFDNPQIRKAMVLAIDRNGFTTILSEGKASLGGAMLPPPEGLWGMPREEVAKLPGYGEDVAKNQAEARKIMEGLGYSEAKPLKVKVSTRNIALYRDPAVILLDQLKKIYIDGELEVVDSTIWHAKVTRKEFSVGLNLTGNGVDDPDQGLVENYTCKSERNLTQYCNAEVDKLIFAQSKETDFGKRQRMVWEIEKRLVEDAARPIIFYDVAATCWHPHVKGFELHTNSIYNNWRFDNVWLEK